MTIEEQFNKDTLWLINELQSELLATSGETISFLFIDDKNVPVIRQQKRVLKWLVEVGAISITGSIYPERSPFFMFNPLLDKPSSVGKNLSVDRPVFAALRKIYENADTRTPEEILEKARNLGAAKKVETTPLPKEPSKVPFFNAKSRQIIYLDKKCDIHGANQFAVCKKLFEVALGTWITESDVVDGFTQENKQSFYDAQRLLNTRVQEELGIKNFIEYKTSRARIDPQTFQKLNESEN